MHGKEKISLVDQLCNVIVPPSTSDDVAEIVDQVRQID